MQKLFALSILLLSLPVFAAASNYDFYVDENYNGAEEGTQEKPFHTIKAALEKASENRAGARRIYIANGEYLENINIEESIKLFGQDKERTKIYVPELATINLAGNNILQNLTFTGGISALTVNGPVTIENCIVKDAKKKGIDLPEGNSLVKISNSSIINNGGKGVYVQKGRSILLQNNTVKNNRGEGFDIRQNIFGVITSNDISNNIESGIEILSSASDVLIKENVIKGNLANGVANQSYPDMPDLGKIKIFENEISANGKYGIYCGAPSGGVKTKNFFSQSIALVKNINIGNIGKPVSGSCHFERQTSEFLNDINSDIETTITRLAETQQAFYQLESEIDSRLIESQQIATSIRDASIIRKIFLGATTTDIDKIQSNNLEISKFSAEVSKLLNDTENDPLKLSLINLSNAAKEEISGNDVFITKTRRLNTIFWLPRKIASIFN